MKDNKCNWYQNDENSAGWSGDCGIDFWLEEGKPSENEMNYCCKCGKKLIEHKYEDESEETK